MIEVNDVPVPAPGRIATVLDAEGESGQLPDRLILTAVFEGQIQQIPLIREHAAALVAQIADVIATPLD